jgi:hypothetical protein
LKRLLIASRRKYAFSEFFSVLKALTVNCW